MTARHPQEALGHRRHEGRLSEVEPPFANVPRSSAHRPLPPLVPSKSGGRYGFVTGHRTRSSGRTAAFHIGEFTLPTHYGLRVSRKQTLNGRTIRQTRSGYRDSLRCWAESCVVIKRVIDYERFLHELTEQRPSKAPQLRTWVLGRAPTPCPDPGTGCPAGSNCAYPRRQRTPGHESL